MVPNLRSLVRGAHPIKQFTCLLGAFFILTGFAVGQSPLNKKIFLQTQEDRLDHTLSQIEQQGKFFFAWRQGVVSPDSLVSITVNGETVKWTLDKLFDEQMKYRVVGNHIILQPIPPKSPEIKTEETWQISGYLINNRSGLAISGATVYESSFKNSVLSDQEGFYKIDVDPESPQLTLAYRKLGFRDTVQVIRAKKGAIITLGMEPDVPAITQINTHRVPPLMREKVVEDFPTVRFLVPEKQKKLTLNVLRPVGNVPFQISLLPGISTNRILSGGMENHFSLNIFAGYAHSLNGFEAGGFVNILRDGMKGFQAAGISNFVGGDVNGFQAGGISNRVNGHVKGFQAAGIHNQLAGNVNGFQAAGISNKTDGTVLGVQAAGILNRSVEGVKGLQIAGITNLAADTLRGFQAAGIYNRNGGNFTGFQAAGIANQIDGDIHGAQIAGIYNKAKYVRGIQIGLINVADSTSGVSIGLINIIKNGYRGLEFSANDINWANIALKLGSDQLYNTYRVGYKWQGEQTWSLGLGIGTRYEVMDKYVLSAELEMTHINYDQAWTPDINFLYSFTPTLGIKLGPVELFGGPAARLWFTRVLDKETGDYYLPTSIKPLTERVTRRGYRAGWIGWQAGFRF